MVIDIFNMLLLMPLSLALASKLPIGKLFYSIFIGSFIASASKSDIKNDELKMSIRALRTLTLKQSYKWPLFKLIFI